MDPLSSKSYPVRLKALKDIIATPLNVEPIFVARAGEILDGFLSPGASFGALLRHGETAPNRYKIKYDELRSVLVSEGIDVEVVHEEECNNV